MRFTAGILILLTLGTAHPTAGEVTPYRIGIGDVLKVTIMGQHHYRLDEKVPILDTGTIMLSITGEISVSGLSLEELDQHLTEILSRDYLVDPEVVVQVEQYNSHHALVIGEVRSPGELVLRQEQVSLRELVILTGGPVGDMDKTVVVMRNSETSEAGFEVLELSEVLLEQSEQSQAPVGDGDIVYVLSKGKSMPIFDSENVVYVFGQVGTPGLVPFTQGLTALRVIINAGNFTRGAAPGRTVLKRRTGDKLKNYNLDLERVMSKGEKKHDMAVQPGDVIYVPRAIF